MRCQFQQSFSDDRGLTKVSKIILGLLLVLLVVTAILLGQRFSTRFTVTKHGSRGLCNETLEFQCLDARCIPRFMMCDNIANCAGHEDEKNCTFWFDIPKERRHWCDRKCIDVAQKCDGYLDCYNLSDEKNCS